MLFIFGFLAAAIALALQLVVWLFFPPLFEVGLPITATVLFSLFLLALIEESLRYLFGKRYQQQFETPSLLITILFWIGFVAPEVILGVWQGSLTLPFLAPLILHAILTWMLFFWTAKGRSFLWSNTFWSHRLPPPWKHPFP